jgi:cyclopropane fatty-acyl-phospholipid synthase-like methyltransferase
MSVDPATFERMYRAEEDPWAFATSPYESAKYDRTIAALHGRRFHRGLELGCSIGVLTARLAGHCDELVALDTSPTAVARARERVGQAARIEVATLPDGLPAGTFDLIVASEVLYYFAPEPLGLLLDALEAALDRGGALLAVHWRPPTRTYPLLGDEVHAILRARPALRLVHAERHPRYRLDLLERT